MNYKQINFYISCGRYLWNNTFISYHTEYIQVVYISVDYLYQHEQFPYHQENYNPVVFQMVHMMIL